MGFRREASLQSAQAQIALDRPVRNVVLKWVMTGTQAILGAHRNLYIGGKWEAPSGSGSIAVISASTEEVIGSVPEGTAPDVDRAVRAARAAFDGGWSETSVTERADWLRKLAGSLKERTEQIATTIAHEVGSPLSMATNVQAGLPVAVTNSYAQLVSELKLEEEIGNSLVVREPFGVVGAITPWNYPLHQIMAKVAPALAAGCTVVLKPSEVAPLNAFLLAEACESIGLPAGVLNIVTGFGPVAGEAIAAHPMVDMVSFTGSLRAGKRVGALAADTIKKVTLELGGKSAFVVLDDAPFEKAIPAGARNAMLNSGQTCSAWTRMIVPRSRYQEALDLAAQAIGSLKLGDPLDGSTRLGPLISSTQRERVEGYIAKGKQEGARVVMGGGRPAAFAKGYYVEPTIFADVNSKMTIAQEEIFGPVLSVLPYDTEDQAVQMANDTIYGLAGGVWSGDADRALRVARRMRTGQVDVNGGRYNPLAPFGGYKQSGVGRELGKYGLEEFFQVKSIAR
jgi:aldehyde dehydrogenase (NAD+)